MHAASLAAPAGPRIRRGERPFDPRGVAETHQNRIHQMSRPMQGAPFSFPYLRRTSHPLTTFGATSVADAFTTGDLGKEKDSTRHLSSSALWQGRLSPREKREEKDEGDQEIDNLSNY